MQLELFAIAEMKKSTKARVQNWPQYRLTINGYFQYVFATNIQIEVYGNRIIDYVYLCGIAHTCPPPWSQLLLSLSSVPEPIRRCNNILGYFLQQCFQKFTTEQLIALRSITSYDILDLSVNRSVLLSREFCTWSVIKIQVHIIPIMLLRFNEMISI